MTTASLAKRMIRRDLVIAAILSGFIVVGAGGWAATVPLSGAVIAGGTVVVDSNVKRVQHLTGGVVADILVRNGTRVSQGDILIRLDSTQILANLAIVSNHLDELHAREARLIAERDGDAQPNFETPFKERLTEAHIARAVAGETTLYDARRMSRNGRRAQLEEKITQFQEEIGGIEAQLRGKDKEIEILNLDLAAVRQLRSKGLVEQTRVNSLERDVARLTSERGVLVSSIAQTRGKIAETKLQVLQVDEDLRQEVATELREIAGTISELIERKVAVNDQLSRVEIRAPQSGIVHEMAVHARDAIISPGETIMLIVPDTDALEVEAKIAPQDIDQVRVGQSVDLRFSAFNQQTTPEVPGTLKSIGADLTRDEKTGFSYYATRIAVPTRSLKRLRSLKLLPGMPVEVFVKTQDRTLFSYLARPLEDQLNRSLREP